MQSAQRYPILSGAAHAHGVGLIELLVVLAIVAVLVAAAGPSFVGIAASLRLRSAADALVRDLSLARSEAIKRNARVVICKSRSGRACETAINWDAGWVIFQDNDNDGQVGADDLVIHQQAALEGNLVISGNTPVANYVSYTPLGTSRYITGTFQAGTFTVCQRSPEPSEARDIVLSNTGRARIAKRDISRCPEP